MFMRKSRLSVLLSTLFVSFGLSVSSFCSPKGENFCKGEGNIAQENDSTYIFLHYFPKRTSENAYFPSTNARLSRPKNFSNLISGLNSCMMLYHYGDGNESLKRFDKPVCYNPFVYVTKGDEKKDIVISRLDDLKLADLSNIKIAFYPKANIWGTEGNAWGFFVECDESVEISRLGNQEEVILFNGFSVQNSKGDLGLLIERMSRELKDYLEKQGKGAEKTDVSIFLVDGADKKSQEKISLDSLKEMKSEDLFSIEFTISFAKGKGEESVKPLLEVFVKLDK